MEIYAKSALNKEQIESKIKIGCDGIEIQLLTELIHGQLGNYFEAEDVFDLQSFAKYNISVVHAPILSKYGISDVNLETLCDGYDFKLLDQVFYIANYFGTIQNKMVRVIVHSEITMTNARLMGDTWKRIINCVGCLLFKYPYTILCLENVTPLRTNLDTLHLCNNFKFDNVEMVNELRKQLNTDRIRTVLDICHARITEKYMSVIFNEYKDKPCEDYSLENFFKENKDVIGLIHLADMQESGYGKGKHGTIFTEKNQDRLTEVMDLYFKYDYYSPITLEVEETDYLLSDGYASSKKCLDNYLEKRNNS